MLAGHSQTFAPGDSLAHRAKMTAMPFRPSRRGLVPPFIAMDVLRAANEREAAGHSVIHLEVGQPGTPAPAAVLDAARQALAEDRIGYTDALGIPPHERIAGFVHIGTPVRPVEERRRPPLAEIVTRYGS